MSRLDDKVRGREARRRQGRGRQADDGKAGDAKAGDAKAAPAAAPDKSRQFWILTLGSVGVVYGDIGTSPLYAMREALNLAAEGGLTRPEVIGVASLLIWALIVIVTLKYVLFLLHADNRGEGGILSLFALAQSAIGHRTAMLFVLGIAGAALFYGDAVITPAISVLSAVEGIEARGARLRPVCGAGDGGDPDHAVRRAIARHGGGGRVVRADHGGLVRHARHLGPGPCQRRPEYPACLRSAPCGRLSGGARRARPRRARRGVPGGDGRGGALRRHGAFRPAADPDRVAVPGLPGAGAQLSRPGRARARPSRRR